MVLSSSTSSVSTTLRRRLYTATSGAAAAAADGRTKTHVTHTKGKKRGSIFGEKREVKMCRIFFPRIIFFIFDSFLCVLNLDLLFF